jgi:hypothetical protein
VAIMFRRHLRRASIQSSFIAVLKPAAGSPLNGEFLMTVQQAPQWHLTAPLRLAAVALLLAGLSFVVHGWLATILWIGAIVFLILAALKFVKVWRLGR